MPYGPNGYHLIHFIVTANNRNYGPVYVAGLPMSKKKADLKRQLARATGRQKAEAFHEAQLQTNEKYMQRVVYLAPSLFFVLLLPKAVATFLAESVSTLHNTALVAEGGVGAAILALAWVHIKVTDPLRNGTGKEAVFFQKNWPSNYIAKGISLGKNDKSRISRIWFQFFRALAYPTSEYRSLIIWSYRRTYGARLVWLTTRVLLLFVYVGLFVITLDIVIFLLSDQHPDLIAIISQLLIILASLMAIYLIKRNNEVPSEPDGDGSGTGCWKAVKEEMLMQWDIFQRVIGNHNDIGALNNAVDEWEWNLADRMLVHDDLSRIESGNDITT